MRKTVKFIAIVLLVSLMVGALSGCAQFFYGARMYDRLDKYLVLDTFRWSNPIYITTENPGYPDSRSFVIADKATYDTVFVESAFNINFDKEMILLCTFEDCYTRPYYLDKISIKDGKASVYVRMQKTIRDVPDAVVPYQRWLAVKMRKADIETVEFYEWMYDVYNGGRYEIIQ